jgi:hypothetical protein
MNTTHLQMVFALAIAGCGGKTVDSGEGAFSDVPAGRGATAARMTPREQCKNGAFPLWKTAGCGAAAPAAVCEGDLKECAGYACSCEGKVIMGCWGFPEPWAYPISLPVDMLSPREGDRCPPEER